MTMTDYYDLGSHHDPLRKRGRVVILNYQNFVDTTKTRDGTEHDVRALRQTFERFNFDVFVHHDMTLKGTDDILQRGKLEKERWRYHQK